LGNKGVTTRIIKKKIYTVSIIELRGTYSTIYDKTILYLGAI